MRHIGPSLLLTVGTNVSTFLVGAATVMPAIRDFCFHAAFSIAMAFCLLITLYSALLVFDGMRIQTNRLDLIPCVKR